MEYKFTYKGPYDWSTIYGTQADPRSFGRGMTLEQKAKLILYARVVATLDEKKQFAISDKMRRFMIPLFELYTGLRIRDPQLSKIDKNLNRVLENILEAQME